MQLKRWENPRKQGRRNVKGKLAAARARQLKKRSKGLVKKLKSS